MVRVRPRLVSRAREDGRLPAASPESLFSFAIRSSASSYASSGERLPRPLVDDVGAAAWMLAEPLFERTAKNKSTRRTRASSPTATKTPLYVEEIISSYGGVIWADLGRFARRVPQWAVSASPSSSLSLCSFSFQRTGAPHCRLRWIAGTSAPPLYKFDRSSLSAKCPRQGHWDTA